jgi:hypothetical protein
MQRLEINVTQHDRNMQNQEEKPILFRSTPDSVVALLSLKMCIIEKISEHLH